MIATYPYQGDATRITVAGEERLASQAAIGKDETLTGGAKGLRESWQWFWGTARKTIEEIAELTRLPRNWDSYGAEPIGRKTAEHAIMLLPRIWPVGVGAPIVEPVADGRVQLSWEIGNFELELTIGLDRSTVLCWDASVDAEVWSGPLNLNESRVIALLQLARS